MRALTAIRHTLLAAGVLAAALLATAASAAGGKEPFGEMTVDEVATRLGQPGFHVLDANGPERYAKAHVPGAKQVHFKKLSEADLPADRAATLVFYCSNTR